METIIELENLTKRFGKHHAVNALTLSVPPGSVTAFLGPNGAGKTTTIKCLLNLLVRDEGSARVLGCDSAKLGPRELRQLGYVSENQELPLWMTVTQFLNYCRPMYPDWDSDFEKKLLKSFELPLTTKLRSLSRGQRMKAALLSSLAYRPKLVVLDEPFSGLDALVRDEFLHGLLELTETEDWTVLLSSHDIDEVERLADRVAILNGGHLAVDESTEHLQERFRQMEIHLGSEETPLPNAPPKTWLNVEKTGRVVRFIETGHVAAGEDDVLKAQFPGMERFHSEPMKLREIFVTLAKTYRLS